MRRLVGRTVGGLYVSRWLARSTFYSVTRQGIFLILKLIVLRWTKKETFWYPLSCFHSCFYQTSMFYTVPKQSIHHPDEPTLVEQNKNLIYLSTLVIGFKIKRTFICNHSLNILRLQNLPKIKKIRGYFGPLPPISMLLCMFTCLD